MKPILMSTPMVQSTLKGIKTKTRRIIDPQPLQHNDIIKMPIAVDEYARQLKVWAKKGYTQIGTDGPLAGFVLPKCPYGEVGDVMWVRESWRLNSWGFEDPKMIVEFKTGEKHACNIYDPCEDLAWLINQIEQLEEKGIICKNPENNNHFSFTDKPQPWKPSIHMPKEACRLFLKIKSIKVERLQDISEEDAKAEGVKSAECDESIRLTCLSTHCKEECSAKGTYYNYPTNIDGEPCYSAKESFKQLWNMINGSDSWNANHWVWVIEFEVTEKPNNF